MGVRGGYFDDVAAKNEKYNQANDVKKKKIRDGWMNQEPEFLPSQGGDNALERGTHSLKSSTGFAGNMTAQHYAGAAKDVAESVKYQTENPSKA